jgi:hypothetical protein
LTTLSCANELPVEISAAVIVTATPNSRFFMNFSCLGSACHFADKPCVPLSKDHFW